MLPSHRIPFRLLHNLRNPSLIPSFPQTSAAPTITLKNPITNTQITQIPSTAPSSLSNLLPTPEIQATWRETPLSVRLAHLQNLDSLLAEHAHDLAYLIHLEVGKPLSEALAELAYARDILQWCSQPALHSLYTSFTRHSPSHHTLSTLAPIGPVLAITPFNLPLALAVRKLAPALAAGCTVVAKPSEKAALPLLALGRLLEEAGLPKGVFVPITGGAEVVTPLLQSDHINMLSFTGSTTVGRLLQMQAAGRRCLLELGGNAPFIVFDNCDIQTAVKDATKNRLRCAGQTCIAPNRIFVQDSVHDLFVEELCKRVRRANVGPVIDQQAKEMVVGRVERAVHAGAKRIFGEDADGCFVTPTVLMNVDDRMEVVSQETFGPVFSVMRFVDEGEVVERANAKGGLAAYVYSGDLGTGLRMVDRINAGMVGLNSVNLSSGETEFGGLGETGLGREGGFGAIQTYSERKFCVVES